MCMMTETGTRWKREIELPDFGDTQTYWVVPYGGEQRYTREPDPMWREEVRRNLKPLYAIRVIARSI